MATSWGNIPGLNRGQDIAISGLTAAGTYMNVGVAVDLDNNTIQFIVGDDVSFGAKQSISGITGAKFPIYAAFNGDAAIADFAGTAWEHAAPVGHSAWDAACTWNPADKDASITLSGSNLTATGQAAIFAWRAVRGTVSHTTGKWYYEIKVKNTYDAGSAMVGVGNASATLTNYPNINTNAACIQCNGNFGQNNSFFGLSRTWDNFSNDWRTLFSDTYHTTGRYYVEVTCNAVSSAGSGLIIGIGNGSAPLNNYLGSDAAGNSAGFQSSRQFIKSNSSAANILPSALTATHVIGLDINLTAGTIAANIDGGAYSAAQNIASIIGAGIGNVPVFFCISFLDAPSTYDSVTANFGATAFAFTPPVGASSWDTSLPTLETRVSLVDRNVLIDGSGALNVSFLNRETLQTIDSPLNVSTFYRMVLVSNTVTGAGTSLFVSTLYRSVLVAEAAPTGLANAQTAVTVMA